MNSCKRPMKEQENSTYELTRRVLASLHATDTLWHAHIDFLSYSDDHLSWQSGLCLSQERSAIEQARTYADLPIISSSFEMATCIKGLKLSRLFLILKTELHWPLVLEEIQLMIFLMMCISECTFECLCDHCLQS